MDPFESYALPLHNIKNHKLIQPVFGSTIIQCKVKPSEDQAWELPKDCVHVFKAYFNEGQFSKFDNCLTLSLKQIRKTSYLKNYQSDEEHDKLYKFLEKKNVITVVKDKKHKN